MSNSIKIAHLTSAHQDGDVRIFHKECVSLAKAGYDVSMIIPNTTSRLEKGVNVISFQIKKGSRFFRAYKVVNQVYKQALKLNAQVYHLHDPELLRIALKLKRKGKIVIYDAHEDLPRQVLSKSYIPKIFRSIISFFLERYENARAKKLDGIVCATPFIRDRFKKINSNSLDINNYPILQGLSDSERMPDPKNRTICYAGSIAKVRGVLELVNSLPLANCHLVLAGNFSDLKFKAELENSPGWRFVDYRGFLNRQEIGEMYRTAHVGIVTLHPIINYLDSLPVKMFEYMAAGLPVLASDFPLWKSIIHESGAGVCVNPLSSEDISKELVKLLENVELTSQMSINGRRAVREKFNWNIEEAKLLNFYSTTLKQAHL